MLGISPCLQSINLRLLDEIPCLLSDSGCLLGKSHSLLGKICAVAGSFPVLYLVIPILLIKSLRLVVKSTFCWVNHRFLLGNFPMFSDELTCISNRSKRLSRISPCCLHDWHPNLSRLHHHPDVYCLHHHFPTNLHASLESPLQCF